MNIKITYDKNDDKHHFFKHNTREVLLTSFSVFFFALFCFWDLIGFNIFYLKRGKNLVDFSIDWLSKYE